MSRPRTATELLKLKGAFAKNPARGKEREDEPVPVGDLGEAPAWFDDMAVRCWDEIVSYCHAGTTCYADRAIVEQTAMLLTTLRRERWNVHPSIMGRYEACLSKLGLTPADRSKVKATPQAPRNNFAAVA